MKLYVKSSEYASDAKDKVMTIYYDSKTVKFKSELKPILESTIKFLMNLYDCNIKYWGPIHPDYTEVKYMNTERYIVIEVVCFSENEFSEITGYMIDKLSEYLISEELIYLDTFDSVYNFDWKRKFIQSYEK